MKITITKSVTSPQRERTPATNGAEEDEIDDNETGSMEGEDEPTNIITTNFKPPESNDGETTTTALGSHRKNQELRSTRSTKPKRKQHA